MAVVVNRAIDGLNYPAGPARTQMRFIAGDLTLVAGTATEDVTSLGLGQVVVTSVVHRTFAGTTGILRVNFIAGPPAQIVVTSSNAADTGQVSYQGYAF